MQRKIFITFCSLAMGLAAATSASAQFCDKLEWNWAASFKPHSVDVRIREWAMPVLSKETISVRRVEFYARHYCASAQKMDVRILEDASGKPDRNRVHSFGNVTIDTSHTKRVATGTPKVLIANRLYWLVFAWNCGLVNSVSLSFANSGPASLNYSYTTSRGWTRQSQPMLYRLLGAPARAPYVAYGTSCKGVASCSPTPFQSYNWNKPSKHDDSRGEPNEYAIKLRNPDREMDICKVQFQMRTLSGVHTARVSIYHSLAPHALLGRTTMRVGTSNSTYTANFESPVRIKAGANYYVGVWLTKNGTKSLTDRFEAVWPISGGPGTTQHKSIKRTSSWGWASSCDCTWNVQVFKTTGLVPNPRLRGTQFVPDSLHRCNLDGVGPGMVAIYLLDFRSLNNLNGILLGSAAPGCRLYNLGGLLTTAAVTDASGRLSIALPIDKNRAFCGWRLYEQFAVLQRGANGLGLILSNGGWSVVNPY